MKAFNALPFQVKKIVYFGSFVKIAPTIFFEDFSSFKEKSLNFFSGINPEVIYTANGFAGDFCFQLWVAEKQKNGASYVVGQHGNNYGTLAISKYFPETRVPEYLITW